MHVLGIFGGLKRWICFVGCIVHRGGYQDWAQFSCPDADFIVPADWQALDTNEKQQIADQADALLRRQRLEGGGSSASKVRHLRCGSFSAAAGAHPICNTAWRVRSRREGMH